MSTIYVPHLRGWFLWNMDRADWPFVPLNYEPWTDAERAAMGYLDRYHTETDEEYALRKRARDHAIRYGQFFLQVPFEDEDCYEEYQRLAQENYLRDMAQLGWWELERDKRDSVIVMAKPLIFAVEDFPKAPHATLANVMHKAGMFESVSEARRNGWNKPIVPGTYMVGKEKKRIQIVSQDERKPLGVTSLEITARFDSGDPITFSINHPEHEYPVADWAVACRRWTGEASEIYWEQFEQCCYSEAVAACVDRIYMVRNEPSVTAKNRRTEVIMPLVSRNGRVNEHGALAMQIERSYASIAGRSVRKFLGLSLIYR